MSSVGEMTKVPPANAAGNVRDPSRALPLAKEKPEAAPRAAPEADSAALQRAVEELNRHFSATRTDLKFSVEKDLGQIVVAVVDSKDGTVLRQIPSAEALRIARIISEARSSGGSNLIEAVA